MIPDECLVLVLLVTLRTPPNIAPQLGAELLGHHVTQQAVSEVPLQFGVR